MYVTADAKHVMVFRREYDETMTNIPPYSLFKTIQREKAANKSLQATRDGRASSASRFTLIGPTCLVCVPKLFSRGRGE
jgi:hypothetical protein